MVNETLPVGTLVEVTKGESHFIGTISEVSSTYILDDVWYRVEPLPSETENLGENQAWYHMKHVNTFEII